MRKLEKIDGVDLHSFGNASNNGVSAVVHPIVHQETDVNQGFVAAKVQLAKKSFTILRKELVAGHVLAYLVRNVKKALEHLPFETLMVGSTVQWLYIASREWRIQTIPVQSCEKNQRN